MIDPKAIFLGPYGENQNEFKKQVETLLNDIIQWRRNYHPNDRRLIESKNKETFNWKQTNNNLERELDRLLGELKQSIPFHNPRFIGHMHSDLVIPSLLGYMAGQLYNQNNVVGESSPVTTLKELEYIGYLCEMFNYPTFEYSDADEFNGIKSTGHLTSGGTVANIEALWTARNMKYFPLSLKLFSEDLKEEKEWLKVYNAINEIKIYGKLFSEYKAEELFNLSPSAVLKLTTDLRKSLISAFRNDNSESSKIDVLNQKLKNYSVRVKGVYGLHSAFNDNLEIPYLIVPQSRHYSWEKAMDILGIGSEYIKYVKVDENFRIDPLHFAEICENTSNILMAVSVMGTTEEGVVDPISKLMEIKQKVEVKKKYGFWFHIDAAYGGFYASFFKDPNKPHSYMNVDEIADKLHDLEDYNNIDPDTDTDKSDISILPWINDSTIADFENVCKADSISIDPHKMGYIPYSAGAILYRDSRVKSFIEKKAPYLASAESEELDSTKIYLGGSTLEGSRSGASALACYLSSKVISNDFNGYGRLVYETFKNAKVFIDEMFNSNEHSEENHLNIEVYPLYDFLSNIVCYAVGVKDVVLSGTELNMLNNRLYEEMSAEKNKSVNNYKFIVSKTALSYDKDKTNYSYSDQIDTFLSNFKIKLNNSEKKDFDLVLLRSTFMNPMLSDIDRRQLFKDFFQYLQNTVQKVLPEILLERVLTNGLNERHKVLWIENQVKIKEMRNAILKGGKNLNLDISRFLDIDFVADLDELPKSDRDINDYKIFIVDLNLSDTLHKEWRSGIEVLRKVRNEYKNDPLILVYSQFLNSKFKIKRADGKLDHISHREILVNYFGHYLQLGEDNLVAKSIATKFEVPVTQPVELDDLDEIITKLSKLVFNDIKNREIEKSINT